MSDTLFTSPGPAPASGGGGVKTAILFGAILALVGATAYQFYQLKELRSEIEYMRDQVASQILTLQTNLQASYKTTAMLAQLSLTKFL